MTGSQLASKAARTGATWGLQLETLGPLGLLAGLGVAEQELLRN